MIMELTWLQVLGDISVVPNVMRLCLSQPKKISNVQKDTLEV